MIALRWLSFLLAVECLWCLALTEERDLWSSLLALEFFALILVHCWTYRSPRKARHAHHRATP